MNKDVGQTKAQGTIFTRAVSLVPGADTHTQPITVSACGVYLFSVLLHSCCPQHSWPWPGARGLLSHTEPPWLMPSCCPAAPPGPFLPSHCPQPAVLQGTEKLLHLGHNRVVLNLITSYINWYWYCCCHCSVSYLVAVYK